MKRSSVWAPKGLAIVSDIEPQKEQSEIARPVPPPGYRRDLGHGLAFSLAAACLGLLRGLNIAGEDAKLLLQGTQLRVDLPLPARLVSGYECVERIAYWGLISSVAVAVLSAALGLIVLHRLNTRFLASRPADDVLRRELNMWSLVCALPPLLLAGVAGLVAWRLLTPAVQGGDVFAGAVFGGILFALLGEGGPWSSLTSLLPRRPPDQWGALSAGLLGALAGIVVAGAAARDPLLIERDLMALAQGMSEFDCSVWHWAPWLLGSVHGVVSFCAAGVVWALAKPHTGWGTRLFQAAPSLLVGLTLGLTIHYGYQRVAVGRYDFGVTLTGATHARTAWLEPRAVLTVLGRDRPVIMGVAPRHTGVGLSDDDENTRRVLALLQRRQNRTALAAEAFVYLRDRAALQWDSAALADTALLSARRAPFQFMQAALMDSLSAAHIAPPTTAAVRQLADPHSFQCCSAIAHRRVADLLQRYGFRETALNWYRLAGASPREIERLRAAPPFVVGSVRGQVLVGEAPAVGFRVGLIAASRAPALAGALSPADQLLIGVSTVTDARGRFVLTGLVPGQYALAVAAERSKLTRGATLAGLDASFAEIVVARDRLDVDVGYLRIIPGQEPRPAPAGRGALGGSI